MKYLTTMDIIRFTHILWHPQALALWPRSAELLAMLAEAGEAARSSARLRRDLSAARQVRLPASCLLHPGRPCRLGPCTVACGARDLSCRPLGLSGTSMQARACPVHRIFHRNAQCCHCASRRRHPLRPGCCRCGQRPCARVAASPCRCLNGQKCVMSFASPLAQGHCSGTRHLHASLASQIERLTAEHAPVG